jgi:hypothetical protein
MFQPLFGGLLVAAGILIAGASGLCSLAVLGSALKNPTGSAGMLPLVLIFGGIPFGLGVLLVMGGIGLIKKANEGGPRVY